MNVEPLLAGLDAAAGDRVLVFGSLPPEGRDVDLLVRPAEEQALAAALTAEGFERRGTVWARFGGCSVTAVELVPAADWGLPEQELAALFESAEPLPGYGRLVAPAPAYALLVRARRFVRSRGVLDERGRSRVDALVARDPGVWETANATAPRWGAVRSLALLRRAWRDGTPATRADRTGVIRQELVARGGRVPSARALAAALPRPRRGAIVSFSGLDGAGKSSQSTALAETLDRLGHPAIVLWSPLGGGPVLNAFGKPAKRLLRRMRFGPFRELADRASTGSVMSARPGTGGTHAGGKARAAWATLVAVSDAAAQRVRASRHTARGRVVIFDRHALDSIVRLRFLYGQHDAMPIRRALMRTLAPHTELAFLLDIRAETSRARKDDIWSLDELQRHADLYAEEVQRLPIVRLDGERDREELCAEIARTVWHGLTERLG